MLTHTRKEMLSIKGEPHRIIIRTFQHDQMIVSEFLMSIEGQPLWMYRLGADRSEDNPIQEDMLEHIGLQFIQNMILTERFVKSSGKLQLLDQEYQDGDWTKLDEFFID